jgi:hypothetical protein
LVDFDGDGIGDILSGSWPGELYFFKGLGKGKFAAAQKIKDRDGKEIKAGSASTVFACDWRGTGRLDLLVGCIDGYVFLIPNEGTKDRPAFGKPQKLSAADKEIKVGHGDSHPIMADWEGTGKPGLLVGCGDGSVVFYRNGGTRKEPKLEAPVTLVVAPKMNYDALEHWYGRLKRAFVTLVTAPKQPVRGSRAKVCVVDWNGDGRLDLLVGDFSYSWGEAPKLTEKDRATQKELQAKAQKLQKVLQPMYREMARLEDKAAKAGTPEAQAEAKKKVDEIGKKYQKEMEEQSKVYTALRKFERPMHYHGYVWLYLRKAPDTSARR